MTVRAPRLRPWKLAARFGIELKDQVWNTGSVWAVSPLPHDRLLVGTERSGLWLSEPDASGIYQSRCVSEAWDQWFFNSCVLDPTHSNRIFFGTKPGLGGSAGVYIGDFATEPESWTFIPLPPSISVAGIANRDGAGVASMIILPLQRLLVVGTFIGVGWIQIDRQPFIWNTAPQPITDLANLEGDDFLFVATANSPDSVSLRFPR